MKEGVYVYTLLICKQELKKTKQLHNKIFLDSSSFY